MNRFHRRLNFVLGCLGYAGCLGFFSSLLTGTAAAQDYPNRPVRIISPNAPGSTTDVGARMIADELRKRMGQPVIVENRVGAGGLIGARAVTSAAPDGYTLLYFSGTVVTSVFVKNDPIDTLRELVPVSALYEAPYFFFTDPKLPARSFQELVAYSKANKGKLNHGSQAPTGTLGMHALRAKTGIDFTTIPYKNSSEIPVALSSGDVAFSFDGLPVYRAMIQAGKVKPMFVASSVRSSLYPDVPTAAEVGVPDFEVTVLQGLWAPAGTPPHIIAKLEAWCREAMMVPEVKARAETALSARTVGSTSAEFRRVFERQLQFWANAARLANYTPE